jgi:hypothetical protein
VNDLLAGLARFALRLALLAAGLVFAASLMLALLVLLALWALRALWARLTGRPVAPWVLRVDPRAGWSRFYHASQRPRPPGPPAGGRVLQDVTDVEPKSPRG